MAERMISHAVTFIQNSLINISMSRNILSNAKESGPGIIRLQQVQYIGRRNRMRTVIKTQVHFTAITWHLPDAMRVHLPDPPGYADGIEHPSKI
jgi:hypothetical protein